jgi:tetratricopeptide (TPR) repeat protein
MTLRIRRVLLATLGAWLLAGPAWAQHDDPALPPRFSEPIPLFTTGLGTFHRAISSSSPEAQAFFDQGFQMMFAFAKPEAVRSFRAAWARDPECAICYWGEAWAWGSYLNAPMTPQEAPHAYAASRKALALRARATETERALIDAVAVRYVETFDPATRVEQDRAYAEAMARVWERYPDDLDVGTLYAEALFLLEPRRGARDISDPDVQRLLGVLETLLARDVRHPGACHLYVHATEATTEPGRASGCAIYLGNSIPGASHINHMPSHTWAEIGLWPDAVRANIQAWHSDLKAAVGEGFAIYPEHNLHMLLFAASMDGQGALAIQAGKDYAKLTGNAMYHVLTLVRFGRFDEVVQVTARPRAEVPAGLWDFAQGYARLRLGDRDAARTYLKQVLQAAETSTDVFRFHSARLLLGSVGAILEGELLRVAGDLDAAIQSFQRAVALEDELIYDEPEPLPFAARHWLGAALLEAGRYEEARQTYTEELNDHPHNGWSLFGLLQAQDALGMLDTNARTEFASSWARSDTWIRASRF